MSDASVVVSLPICARSIWVYNRIPAIVLADSLEPPPPEMEELGDEISEPPMSLSTSAITK